MREADRDSVLQTMTGLSELFGKKVSESLMSIYWLTLEDMSLEEFNHAVSVHMRDPESGRFFPKPADLIGRVARSGKQNSELVAQSAELGWSLVMGRLKSHGSYGSLKISDPVAIETVRQMGGWKSLCATDLDKMAFKQREFMSLYQTVVKTPVELLPSELAGRIGQSKQNSKVMQVLRAPQSVRAMLEDKRA